MILVGINGIYKYNQPYDVLGRLKLGSLTPIDGHVDRKDDAPSNLEVPSLSKDTCRFLTNSSKTTAVSNIQRQETSPSLPNCPATDGWKLISG